MTYGKKIARICLVFALVICLLPVISGVDLGAYAASDRVEDAQNSVVRVFVPVWDGVITGSGFAVGDEGEDVEYIVTNNHVVEEDLDNVYVTITDIDNGIPAEVIYTDPVNDFAILKLSKKLTERQPIVLLSPKELHKSEDVYCIGFPGLSDRGSANNNLDSRIEDMTITKGTISNPQYDSDGTICIMSDVKLNSGNSGGPMVDEFGQAVGINTAVIGLDEVNNMSLAVSMDYVMEVLDDENIDYMVGSADGAKKSSSSDKDSEASYAIWIYIATRVGVVLLIVGIVFLIRKLTKKPAPVPASAPKTITAVNPTPDLPQPPETRPRKMKIICERGPESLRGKKFSSHGVVRVGRNADSCQLVFPSGTPGVSKEHCELRLTSAGIVVKDLNSTYGTYLSNREKLAPGSSKNIGSGDIILLGSDKVILSVKEEF